MIANTKGVSEVQEITEQIQVTVASKWTARAKFR